MKKKEKTSVVTILNQFRTLMENKPATAKMFEELQMMKFRVHPLTGDISAINLHNEELIQTLWSLGKLDEVFQRDYQNLSPKEKKVLLRFFDNLHQRLQEDLNHINLKLEKNTPMSSVLEFEIFKDKLPKRRLN